MIPTRADEPDYAKLSDAGCDSLNRYGSPIRLTPVGDEGVSLHINGDDGIGENPNRTRQHAFHFTADNCIGCHACEAACSEKNDLPPHLSFRSVGYVEGGTFPDYQRVNISMACNHCDDPVCLKGCPTRAYTKHPEYGAVIQDPEICFGCGYCTWVCPYNAPQLDPLAGQVEKCNMCVDRLEVGLKPACVSACVGNALDFGVVEETPEGREQTATTIPGFPDPKITQPNIRFEQVRQLPRTMTRTDSEAVKYERADGGVYKPAIDPKAGMTRNWNLARLSSRENPLVAFTLTTQAAVGLFTASFLAGAADWLVALGTLALVGGGLLMSTSHLGKPTRFYRGFNNLRHSNLSREALATAAFGGAVGMHLLFSTWTSLFGWLALPGAIATLWFMVCCYLIPARPFWNHWQSATAFVGAALALGGWAAIALSGFHDLYIAAIVAGIVIEGVGLIAHARDLSGSDHEGAVSHYAQRTTFGWTYITRNLALALVLAAVCWLRWAGIYDPVAWSLLGAAAVATAVTGRALFYVLVVPTTMPGAFFWKNKAFEQHARDIGLAANPQVGVAPVDH